METKPVARRTDGGFTLVEVLVSLLILAVGLLGVEALGIGAVRMNRRAELTGKYMNVAADSLETIRGRVVAMAAGANATRARQTGSLADGAQVQTEVTSAGTRLWTVTVTVTPPSSSRVLRASDAVRLTANVFR